MEEEIIEKNKEKEKNDIEKKIKEIKSNESEEEKSKNQNEKKEEMKEEEITKNDIEEKENEINRKKEELKETIGKNEKEIQIKNRKFIEEIFEFSEEIKDLIPKLKENSENIIKEYFKFLKQYSKKENNNETQENNDNENIELISNNFIQLKEIFTKSTEIAELIQFDEKYYDNEDKENGMIGIFYDLYINISIQKIKTILEEIFTILKKKDDLSKKEINIIFKKIAKEYYWGENNNNKDFTNFKKYIDLLLFFICGKDDLNQFNFFSFELKKCEGINLELKERKLISEGHTINFQTIILTRDYHKNENTKIISIDLSQSKLDLILNGTNIKLYIEQKERKTMNFNIEVNKWYKINFSIINYIDDKIITIGICELNKPKEETQIISTVIQQKNLEISKAKFFENFQGNFASISCYYFDYPRITFEENINPKNIFNLGNDVYWNNSVNREKKESELIVNNQYKYNIYLIGGMSVFLPLFEKVLLYNNEKEIFKKLITLIKEILFFKPLNIVNAHTTHFFKILSLFILNVDSSYFNETFFSDFLFELSDNYLEEIQKSEKNSNEKLEEIHLQSFYSFIFFNYEIIIKIFHNDLEQYLHYINKNENLLYKYMRFNVCGKFLNEINYEKVKDKFFPFIKMLIKEVVNSKTENMNDLIYYLFKSNIEVEYFKLTLKSLIEELSNSPKPNKNINLEFLINLSMVKTKDIEIKLIVIQLFQIIYLKYYQIIKQIFSNPNFSIFSSQIFYFILIHFFDCNIIIEKNEKTNTKENETLISSSKTNSEEKENENNKLFQTDEDILIEIIKEYLLFSINYIGYSNYTLEKTGNFLFKSYFEFIDKQLKFLDEKIIRKEDIMLYSNRQIQSNLVNIYVYCLLYKKKQKKNNEDKLMNHINNIISSLKSFFLKIINEEINDNLCFKEQDNYVYGINLGFPTFILFFRKITSKMNIEYQLDSSTIDELIKCSFQQITNIVASNIDNFNSITLKNKSIYGLQEFILFLNTHSEKIFEEIKKNKSINQLQSVKRYFESLKNQKICLDFIIKTFFQNENNITKNLIDLFKLLNFLTMIFTQFFLKEKDSNIVNNINCYYVFIHFLIELGNFFQKNTFFQKELKKSLNINLLIICGDNILLLSYLCLKNERKAIFEKILNSLFPISNPNNSEYNEINYFTNPFHLINILNSNNKINKEKPKYMEILKFYMNQKNKDNIKIEFKEEMKLPNVSYLWDKNYIYKYNITNYSNISKLQKKYIKIKKGLFSFNGIYSNQNLFYTDKKKDFKYKISTHLTQNFMNPLLIPILDFDYYISNEYQYDNFFYEEKKPNYINLNIFQNNNNENNNFEMPLYYEKIPCCLIKVTHHIKGFIMIKKNIYSEEKIEYFEFIYSEKEEIKYNFDKTQNLCFGSFRNIDKNKQYYLKIKIKDIMLLFPRKYYYYNNAIEIFTNKNKSYYFNFNVENGQMRLLNLISDQLLNLKQPNINFYVNPKIHYKYINITEKWNKGEISTLTFLNLLNIYANRSLKDLTQYPVFPWILNDYKINNEKKNDNNIPEPVRIRQLNLPMAQISLEPNKESIRKSNYETNFLLFFDEIDEKYKDYTMEEFYKDDDLDLDKIPYYYGTHYSNPAYVSHYLTRIFPYTITAWSIQGTSFDSPDRLFINLERSYISCITSRSDLREIIPQFFFFPEMFFNLNKLKLGKLQINNDSNSSFSLMKKYHKNQSDEIDLNNLNDEDEINDVYVNDVLLPFFSNRNAYQFISIYREILELIKKDLIEWINLIFGVNSRGENAKIKKNLFMAYTYDNVIDLKMKTILEDEKDCILRLVELGLTPHQIYDKLLEEEKEKKEKEEKEFNLELKCSAKKIDSVFQVNDDILFYSKDLSYLTVNLKNEKKTELKGQLPFNTVEKIMYITKGKFILILMLDNKSKLLLKIKGQNFNQIVNEDVPDKSIITIVYVDKNEDNIYIGTQNGSLIIYSMDDIISKESSFSPKYFLHHSKKINHINVNNELNMLITCSNDKYVNLYTLPKIELVNSIYRKDIVNYVFLSSSPLPSFVTFSDNKKSFDCYNINCECINSILTFDKIEISIDYKKEKYCNFIRNPEKIISHTNLMFLEERSSYDLNNAFVFTNFKYVDYLIYETNPFFIIRKFPFMIFVKKIAFQQNFYKCFVLENFHDLKFVRVDFDENLINVISLNKKKIETGVFEVLK